MGEIETQVEMGGSELPGDAALAALDAELSELTRALSEFNIFEAIGVRRQELRHSDLLAFLLDPLQPHGLSDGVLRSFFTIVARSASVGVDVTSADLTSTTVQREWRNIDIVIDARPSLVCAIENKIDSGERSTQLRRYRELMQREFRGVPCILVYLTPGRVEPSESDWVPLGYADIATCLESAVDWKTHTDANVSAFVHQYIALIRRHIVTPSEIATRCQWLYRRHKLALDLIFEHRPDPRMKIRRIIEELIRSCQDLREDDSTDQYIRFAPIAWEGLSAQGTGDGWTSTRRLLLFEFQNGRDRLMLDLYVGPGSDAAIRERVVAEAQRQKEVFPGFSNRASQRYTRLFSKTFITPRDNAGDNVRDVIDTSWRAFIKDDLPRLIGAVTRVYA